MPSSPQKQPSERKQAFALVVALSLMAFILLLLLTIVSLVRVETQTASISLKQLKARQNAMLGAMVALGELQRTMGPDRRVTAPAELFDGSEPNLTDPPPPLPDHRRWTGVWNSESFDDSDPQQKEFIQWLASGGTATEQDEDGADVFEPITLVGGVADSDGNVLEQPVTAPLTFWPNQPNTLVENGFAWYVEDEGTKAQLQAEFKNDTPPTNSNQSLPGKGLIPGAVPLSNFTGLEDLEDPDPADPDFFARMLSLRDIDLLPTSAAPPPDPPISRRHRFDYTLRSQGVLSNTRSGGLKKDLTIAFERINFVFDPGTGSASLEYPVFDRVFPDAHRELDPVSDDSDYFLITQEKLNEASDLRDNGYIHMSMLKDYYNLKKFIVETDIDLDSNGSPDLTDVPTLYQAGLDWRDVQVTRSGAGKNTNFSDLTAGKVGPHQMGPANPDNNSTRHKERPYGRIDSEQQTPDSRPYLHSPVGAIYHGARVKTWLEVEPIDPPVLDADDNPVETHEIIIKSQLLTSVMNPYNIAIGIRGYNEDAGNFTSGPKFMNWPQVYIDFDGLTVDVVDPDEDEEDGDGYGLRAFKEHKTSLFRLQSTNTDDPDDDHSVTLTPGTGLVFAAKEDFENEDAGAEYYSGTSFGPNIGKYLTDEGFKAKTIYPRDFIETGPLNTASPRNATVRFLLSGSQPLMNWGNADGRGQGDNFDLEWNQTFYVPFLWDKIDYTFPGRDTGKVPAKTITKTTSLDNFVHDPVTFGFNLRTTTEDGNATRPLIDGNIRARWNNSRWDIAADRIDFDLLSTFRAENEGEYNDQLQYDANIAGTGPKRYPFWGNSIETGGASTVILFDIPREDLVSLGQLQHAPVGRFSYEPSYIIGNSYANPRIALDAYSVELGYPSDGLDYDHSQMGNPNGANPSFNLYDASYLVNEKLWDEYIFTTIPQEEDNYTGTPDPVIADVRDGTDVLPNPRFLPYEPGDSEFTEAVLRDEGTDQDNGAFYYNAGHLLVDGAFNINSTSINAWEAFFKGTKGLPVQQMDENGEITGFRDVDEVRFPRIQSPLGDGMLKSSPNEDYWIGFRALEDHEVRELAEEMVRQVKIRGPFTSLAEFVNRMLIDGEAGHSGALQAALDATVNADINSNFERDADASPGDSTQGAGFPGQLLQGDILQALAPMMSPRTDTFTIRAYGQVGEVDDPSARAWCEVEVQRIPDPVAAPSDPDEFLEELANPTSPFGRQFKVVSFRWLSEDEV